jgi:hypothetical protein
LNAVALGANANLLDHELGKVSLQLLADPARLDESKIACACCNAEFHFDSPVGAVVAAVSLLTLGSAPPSAEGS